MDCSSGECVSLEKAFTEENFDSVETLINKKLSRLTEFQEAVRVMITKALTTHIKDGNGKEMSSTVFIDDDTAILISAGLLELAKKELLKDDELAKKHLDGYCLGREDTLRDMMDFVESKFHGKKAKEFDTPAINIPTWEPPCYNGGPCTNPQMDCINCPRRTTGGVFSTSSGTSTSKAEG